MVFLISCIEALLVLDGIKLIVFFVIDTLLCFGFKVRIIFIVQQCFSSCWAVSRITVKDLSASHAALPTKSWGWTRSWNGKESGQLIQTDQEDIPYQISSCSEIKQGELASRRYRIKTSGQIRKQPKSKEIFTDWCHRKTKENSSLAVP